MLAVSGYWNQIRGCLSVAKQAILKGSQWYASTPDGNELTLTKTL